MIRVLGVDPSLTGTGLCAITIDRTGAVETHIQIIKTGALRGHERLRHILIALSGLHAPDLVVIEGPSYGSQAGQRGHHERAGLWWLATHRLWMARTPYAVVPPSNRAQYATGKGRADKEAVLAGVIRRYPLLAETVTNNNEADAFVLAAMGAHHLGRPLAELPATHLAALAGVEWPALPSDEHGVAA